MYTSVPWDKVFPRRPLHSDGSHQTKGCLPVDRISIGTVKGDTAFLGGIFLREDDRRRVSRLDVPQQALTCLWHLQDRELRDERLPVEIWRDIRQASDLHAVYIKVCKTCFWGLGALRLWQMYAWIKMWSLDSRHVNHTLSALRFQKHVSRVSAAHIIAHICLNYDLVFQGRCSESCLQNVVGYDMQLMRRDDQADSNHERTPRNA